LGFPFLTPAGLVTGVVIAVCIYAGAGLPGLVMLAIFFIGGSAATSWKHETKKRIDPKEDKKRTPGQVIANGGVAGLCGIGAYAFPGYADVFRLMMAGSLAAATADTLSSELGMIYGRHFYNVLTWKKEPRGENGAISAEGTLTGTAGTLLIAIPYAIAFNEGSHILFIILGGTVGNFADSILGAALERRHYIGNNAVNMLNTATGALTVLLFYLF
jgi:uncharacterized protein (TIGR00297 family)